MQRYLDKETEQVRSIWSRYRGGRGTCVGVLGQMYVGVSDKRMQVTPVTENNIIVKLLFTDSHTKYIKGVLVIITQDLEERS
jgi:hypothetical protein